MPELLPYSWAAKYSLAPRCARKLARSCISADIAALGVGGYLSALCRTRIGPFRNSDAKTVGEWEAIIRDELAREA